MKRKAFTLVEITMVILISSVILTVLYQIFSHTFKSFLKSSYKMTNLRAASIILTSLKNDVRCAIVPTNDDQMPIIEKDKFAFYTTSNSRLLKESNNYKAELVTYTWTGNELKRNIEGSSDGKKVNTALVKDFKIEDSKDSGENNGQRYIVVTITVDNEQNFDNRNNSSKANSIELKAVLYPRFFTESLSIEEKYWYATDRGDI